VLVVDLHACLWYTSWTRHDVAGRLRAPRYLKQFVRVERALVELVARLDLLAILDMRSARRLMA